MDSLLSAAHLRRELGKERFAALVSSDNTGAVRVFAAQLVAKSLPTELRVGNRIYEVLSFVGDDEDVSTTFDLIGRAREMSAHLGEDDGQYLLNNQKEIPAVFHAAGVIFVFVDWINPENGIDVLGVYWSSAGGGRWASDWHSPQGSHIWVDRSYALRRK